MATLAGESTFTTKTYGFRAPIAMVRVRCLTRIGFVSLLRKRTKLMMTLQTVNSMQWLMKNVPQDELAEEIEF